MKLDDYSYHRPRTLAQACELGRMHGSGGRFLAGGTELLVDLKNGRDVCETVISLRDVTELKQIRAEDGYIKIGAMVSLADLARSELVRERCPALAAIAGSMAGAQIRNQGTVGGNFCRAVPCADTPPVCIAAEARLRIIGVETDRLVKAENFFVGPRQTVLLRDQLLESIWLPEQPPRSGTSYQRFSLRRELALAVAAVAARVVLDGDRIAAARLVLNAVAPTPLLAVDAAAALAGHPLSAESLQEAGRLAAAAAQPIDDVRASAAYRRELVEVLTVRAVREAAARAGGAAP
jgi:carbon-monoxide dehydrogenase medium subunit